MTSDPVLAARSVSFAYDGHPAVSEIDLEIVAGSSTGVVGESGSGKSTLARLLVGWLQPDSGSVTVAGKPWAGVRRGDVERRRVQMVFQDPYTALNPRLEVRAAVAEVIRVWSRATRQEALAAADNLLASVGLSRIEMARRPRRLSGGQCQRVVIARALACDPDVLIADEPTSSLDASVQAQILDLLLRLQAERGMALVTISHDLSVIRSVAEFTLVMYGGRVVERGPTARLFEEPHHPYTRILRDSMPGVPPGMTPTVNDVPSTAACVFAARCPRVSAVCVAETPPVASEVARSASCHHPLGGLDPG